MALPLAHYEHKVERATRRRRRAVERYDRALARAQAKIAAKA
jgi:ribosomal protein L44E